MEKISTKEEVRVLFYEPNPLVTKFNVLRQILKAKNVEQVALKYKLLLKNVPNLVWESRLMYKLDFDIKVISKLVSQTEIN